MRYPKTIQIDPNEVQVAPFGPKLWQNVALRLRIIFQALLGLKAQLKDQNKKNMYKLHCLPIFIVFWVMLPN